MTDQTPEWRCVLSTRDVILLDLAKSILQGEEIRYVVEGETMEGMERAGRNGVGLSHVAGPMELWVWGEQADEATSLLKDLRMGPPDA